MIKTDEAALALLNSLTVVCHDGQAGYETAAKDMPEPKLQRTLGELAAQRMAFADELAARVKLLRGEPAKRGSLAASLHRKWIDVQANNARARIHAILAECERAEDVSVRAYRAALEIPDIDAQTRKLVQAQYEQVQLAHDRVRQLRDDPAYAYR